ncbi:CHAT domain-containing protein [Streptomyces sp. NPDC006627]|uniref:CHAT domain-containing protein n=1 Tax=Streptomyces sp. NPDC006627 TaxID=3154679 RepID=UPI0033A26A13
MDDRAAEAGATEVFKGDLGALTVAESVRLADSTPPGHPVRPGNLEALAALLIERYESTQEVEAVRLAVELMRESAATTPPDDPARARRLSWLGVCLRLRWECGGGVADLHEAVDIGRRSMRAAPLGHPFHVMCLANSGNTARSRYEALGDAADLAAAIAAFEGAIAAAPEGHDDLSAHHNNLGVALQSRFDRTGDIADADRAIAEGRLAVDGVSGDHPRFGEFLFSLAGSLLGRHERTGAIADLDDAIRLGRAAVEATADGHAFKPERLAQLSMALRLRYVRKGLAHDADAAVAAGRAAAAAVPPGHVFRSAILSTASSAFLSRYETTRTAGDLDTAIRYGTEALEAMPEGHPGRSKFLANLVGMLVSRYARDGVVNDLNKAIKLGRQAFENDLVDAVSRTSLLFNLGSALRSRFLRTRAVTTKQQATAAYTQAAKDPQAAPSLRIAAARSAAALLAETDAAHAAALLEKAVLTLPETTARNLRRADQEHALVTQGSDLACDAAALAMAGRPGEEQGAKALGILELGRTVLLSQALDVRSDLADLRRHHPVLADRFTALRDQLDVSDSDASLEQVTFTEGVRLHGRPVGNDARNRLAEEFADALDAIRAQEGFETFGRPPAPEELLAEAEPGPVVVFNVSRYRSDALVLTSSGVVTLPLPALGREELARRTASFRAALRQATTGTSGRERRAAQQALGQTLEWLWDSAVSPVLDLLGHTGQPADDEKWPRVWWAPGGLLGQLPLHAAGYHTEPATGVGRRTAMDRVVSSYTPTVRALRYARRRATPTARARALAVSMPTTPGLPGGGRLRHVGPEVAALARHVPDLVLLSGPAEWGGPEPAPPADRAPTKAEVLLHLPSCPIVHFACHGLTDPDEPSSSRLLLMDHERDPLTVAGLTPVHADAVQLAYLSACHTAVSHAPRLMDEAIHLASAFQLIGFPRVIGTAWEVDDQIAAAIAGDFYARLRLPQQRIDTGRSAHALHEAVRDVRDRFPGTPSLWASFLHVGA